MRRYFSTTLASRVVLVGLLAGAILSTGCSRSSTQEGGSSESAAELPYLTADTTFEAMVKAGEVVPASDARAAASNPGSKPTSAFDEAFAAVLAEYHAIRKTLAGDSNAGVAEAATRLRTALQQVKGGPLPGLADSDNEAIRKALEELDQAAAALEGKEGLEADRVAFGKLSAPTMYLVAFHYHAPADRQPYVYYCPMKKLAWLQDVKSMGNPYYGSMMLTCGEVVLRAADTTKQN